MSDMALMYDAAKARLKAVRERIFESVAARIRANYNCRGAWLKMSAEAAFDRIYLFEFFRTYGNIFMSLEPTLRSFGAALNHHLRAMSATYVEAAADDLVASARTMMKIQFQILFCDLCDLADDIKSGDNDLPKDGDQSAPEPDQSVFASKCAAFTAAEVRADVLPVCDAECGGGL
jgi:hypothetical protein